MPVVYHSSSCAIIVLFTGFLVMVFNWATENLTLHNWMQALMNGMHCRLKKYQISNKLLKVSTDTGLGQDEIKLRQEKFGPHKITERKEV